VVAQYYKVDPEILEDFVDKYPLGFVEVGKDLGY
jgi:hypothetical protein